MARVILLCGLPGSGKTTSARRLAAERPGLRLSPDEWMAALDIDLYDQPARARVEQLQWQVARDVVALGVTVIIEWGTWAREERDTIRRWCREHGVGVELHHLDVPTEVLWERLQRRNQVPGETVIERHDLLQWEAELFEAPSPEELALFDPPPE